MGIKQDIEKGIEHGVKTIQIKIAIKMLEEISEIVGLDLNTSRTKKVYLIEMRSVIMELKKEIHIKM